MRCMVTGTAGFVGSTLAERLIELGHEVVGIDRFTDYYPRAIKEKNISALRDHSKFRLLEIDLGEAELDAPMEGIEVVFHQAAQAGVRASWGQSFALYTHNNVLATQRVLEAARHANVKKVVYASSSSVYGETEDLPMRETSFPRPYSPYGVTKLASEHLCELYRHNFGLATASLRYFTVYGPRQRPDMGFNKFIRGLLAGEKLPIFGDGEQTRDFTFIADAVEANLLAIPSDKLGVFNIGGGSRVTLNRVLRTLYELLDLGALGADDDPRLDRRGNQPGDVRHTWADTTRARDVLGFDPKVKLEEGLAAQIAWHRG